MHRVFEKEESKEPNLGIIIKNVIHLNQLNNLSITNVRNKFNLFEYLASHNIRMKTFRKHGVPFTMNDER